MCAFPVHSLCTWWLVCFCWFLHIKMACDYCYENHLGIRVAQKNKEMHIYKVKGGSILEHTTAASKFTRRSSSEKSAFPKGMWTIPVLSALYSTFPLLNSAIAWNAFDQSISLSKIIISSGHIISATRNLYNEIDSLNALSSTLVWWYMLNTHNGDKSATTFYIFAVFGKLVYVQLQAKCRMIE